MDSTKIKVFSSLVDKVIIHVLVFIIVIFRSLKTLSQLFSYGIFKKEVLTSKSNLGFDLKIKIK